MFEALLEKILQSKLGRYLNGLDEKNLKVGVWSGNVIIENVSLKPTVFELFHFPIKLIYSYIGKISLKIPWKSLSSSPVEVLIENVYAVVSPKSEEEWSFTDYNKFNQRLELLDQYAGEIMEKFLLREKLLENKADDKKESSYMDKVALKVLDNLQITIKSIHVRMENPMKDCRFSFGVTLDYLSIHATNQTWEKAFIDRSDPKNAGLPNHKILILNNLAIYWNSEETKYFCDEKNKNDIQMGLMDLIKIDQKEVMGLDYLINIKAQLKSIQNAKNKFGPEFWFSLNMEKIDGFFKKNQIIDMIKLSSFANKFKNAFDENKKKTLQLNENPEANQALFLSYYNLWQVSDKNRELFKEEDWKHLSDIVTTSRIEFLYEWTKQVMRDIHKDQNLKKKEIEKKKASKKSFWSWGSSDDDSKTFSTDDRKELESFYEKNFSDDILALPGANLKDPRYVDLEFEIMLDSGSFSLILSKNKGLIEKTVLLEYKGLSSNIKKRENNKEVKFQLKELEIVAFEKNQGKQIFTQGIFNKNDLIVAKKQKEDAFLRFSFEENPLVDEKADKGDTVKLDYYIDLSIGSNKVTYHPIAIKWVRKFFDVEVEDQDMVDKTMKKINKINEDYQVVLKEKLQTLPVVKINVKMESPYMIIPLNSIGRRDNPACWFVNFGEFSFMTNEGFLKKNLSQEERIYDNFLIKLAEMRVIYFPSMDLLKNQLNFDKLDEKKVFPLLSNINIEVNLKKIKKNFQEILKEKPEIVLDVGLNRLEVDINNFMFQEILYLQSYFTSVDRKEFQSKLVSRNKLNENAEKIGKISKKRSYFQAWTEYFAILSKGKIYLFEKTTDLRYSSVIHVYNAILIASKEQNKNCFTLEHREKTYTLAFDSEKETNEWLEAIQKSQNQKDIKHELKMIDKKKQISQKIDKFLIFVTFQIPEIQLRVADSFEMKHKWLTFSLRDLTSELKINSLSNNFSFKLSELTLYDELRKYQDPFLRNLLTSVNPDKANVKELINIQIEKLDQKHPKYQNLDLEIKIDFGHFFVNYKPFTVIKIMEFVKNGLRDFNSLEIDRGKSLIKNEELVKTKPKLMNDKENVRKDKIQKGAVLMKIHMKWDILSISLNHYQSFLNFMELNLSKVDFFVILSDENLKVKGSLNDLTINDLSNYPKCIFKEEEFSKIVKKEIFGKTEKNNDSILDFTFTQIVAPELIKDNLESFVDVRIHSIKCDIYVQILMNLVDYILIQIMGIINNPDVFRNFNDAGIKEINVDEIIQKIKKPKFMKLNVVMENFFIVLKPLPESEEFFIVKLTKIEVLNKIIRSRQQIVNKNDVMSKEKIPDKLVNLYNEIYQIFLRDFVISVQRKGKPLKSLSSLLEYSLMYQGICFEKEYLSCYENLEFDKTILLRSMLQKSSFYLDKYDYDLMLYLIFFNLTYESERPKGDYVLKEENKEKSKIFFQMDIEEINVYGISSQLIKENYQVPLFKIYFKSLRVNFKRVIANDIEILGTKLDISHYELLKGDSSIQELSLLSNLAIVQIYGIEHNFFAIDHKFEIDDMDENRSIFGFKEFNEKQTQFKAKIELTPDGSKNINLGISDIKLLVHVGFFMNLANFALFDESISGPPPQNKIDAKDKMQQVDKILNFSMNIHNVCLCIPIPDSNECLTTRGQINFVLQNIDRDQSQKNPDKVIDEKNNISRMNLHLPEFEIFKCNQNNLVNTENPKLVSKRSIIEPISFLFNTKKYENVNRENKRARGVNTILNLSNSILKFSYKDFVELFKTIDFQLETLNKSKSVVFTGLKLKKLEQDIINVNAKEPPTETNIDFSLPNLQLIVINDLGISFSPFINFVIYESPFTFKMIQDNDDICVLTELVLPISSSYYNAQINKWEPILEKIHFLIDLCYNTKINPNLVLNIENEISTSNLNLNFSTEMMKSVLKGIKFIKESSLFLERRDSKIQMQESLANEEDGNQYVSPYMISNKTGYPLEICREQDLQSAKQQEKKSKDPIRESFMDKKYYVENNSSINFQIENDDSYFFTGSNLSIMSHYLRVSAEIIKKTVYYKPLPHINIQMTHLKEHKVYGGTDALILVTDVFFDAETNQKILTISSPIIMKNTTQKIIEIKFPAKPESILIVLNPGDSHPVPFDLVSGEMQIKFTEIKEWSIPTLLSNIYKNKASKQIHILDKFLNIRAEEENNYKTILIFEPPFTFKNCLPISLKMQLNFKNDDESQQKTKKENSDIVVLDPQESYDIYDIPLETVLYCQLTIQGFKTTQNTLINSAKVPEKLLFRTYDQKGWQQNIILTCYIKNNGAHKFYFHTKAYIINETYFNLYFYTNNAEIKKKQPIPGQLSADPNNKNYNDKILLLSEETNLLVCEQSNINETSNEIGLEVLNNTLAECCTKKGFIQMAMRMSLLCVEKDRYLYSKVISIIPRHVFVNMTKYNIGVKQTGTDEVLYVSPEEKKQLFWSDYKKTRLINMIIQESDVDFQNSKIDWMFSQDVDISNLGINNLVIRQKGNHFAKKHFKLEIINEEGLIYILMKEYQDKYGPFLIKNSLENVSLFFKQDIPEKAQIDFPFDRLDSKNQAIFSWDYPLADKVFMVFFVSDTHEKMKSALRLNTLNNINETYQFILMPKNPNEEPLVIIVLIRLFKDMKIVEFIDAKTRNVKYDIEVINENELEVDQKKKEMQLSIKFIVKMKSIGISFIQNTKPPFTELIFICFKGFELIALDKNRIRTYQLRLKNFVINNNSSDLVRFPVVINSMVKNVEVSDKFLLNMICKRHLDSTQIEIIDSFRFDMEALRLKIERNLLESMIEYVDIISEILSKSSSSFQSDLFQQQGKYIYKLNKNEKPSFWDWEKEELKLNYNQIFFQEIIIAPLVLSLTFVNQIKTGEFKLNPLSMLLNSMLSAIANLEDIKLKLTGLQLFNCTDTQEGIVSKLETHYKQNIVKELFTTLKIFNIIGHADFVGNPIGLFQNISTGFSDLVEKPIEGFVKGPLEGGKGLFEGAGSLAKNTFTGTFNTVKVITGSLSSGIASLSQDKEFLQEREKMKLKEVKHVGQGLTQGVESIVSGVGHGITGLFTKPFEGTKKSGVKGLFTGAFQGVTGLFVKPITGVLDAVSKTSEGVKNTALIFDKEKEDQRERDPRIFYGFDKFYENYKNDDVDIMRILKKKKKGRFAKNCYFGFKKYLPLNRESNNFYLMIFTLETIINFNCAKEKIDWYISVLNVKAVAKTGGGIKFFLKEQDKKLKLQELWTKIDNEVVLNEIVERAQFLVEMQMRLDQIF